MSSPPTRERSGSSGRSGRWASPWRVLTSSTHTRTRAAALALFLLIASAGSTDEGDPSAARRVARAEPPFVSCGYLPFRPAALERPRGYERRNTPAARALRSFLRRTGDEYGPRRGWFRIVRRGDTIDFGAGRGPIY